MMRLLAAAVLLAAPAESAFAAQWRPTQAVAQRPVRTAARALRLAKISATVDSAAAEPEVVEPVATKPASTLAGLARWDPQAWVIPASWNTGPFRAAALVVTLGATAAGSTALGARAARFAHLIAFGSLLGSMVYTTFFAGLTMCAACIPKMPIPRVAHAPRTFPQVQEPPAAAVRQAPVEAVPALLPPARRLARRDARHDPAALQRGGYACRCAARRLGDRPRLNDDQRSLPRAYIDQGHATEVRSPLVLTSPRLFSHNTRLTTP